MWGVLLGGLFFAGVARAEEQIGVPAEIPLHSPADLSALCAEVAPDPTLDPERHRARGEALAAVYRMSLPSAAFAFEEYDAARARLVVAQKRGFRSRPGRYELLIPDAAGGALDVAIPTTAPEAESLLAARKAGTLALTLWFRLLAKPDESPCLVVHSVHGKGVRLFITPLAFALKQHGQLLVRGETEAFTALAEKEAPVLLPRVVVQAPVLTETRGLAPLAVAEAARGLEPRLVGCYQSGLKDDPGLRGALVIGLALTRDGKVKDARPEIDSLGAPAVTMCVLKEVRATRFPQRGAARVSLPFKFGSAE